MINKQEVFETVSMIQEQKLDIRTITMGISLRDCADENPEKACTKIYDKITKTASELVKTGENIEMEYGIPIINKRISVTPMAMVAESSKVDSYIPFAQALDKAGEEVGVHFIRLFVDYPC